MQNIASGFDHGALKFSKHALIYSSFRENITHGLAFRGKPKLNFTYSIPSKLMSNWTREQRDRYFWVSTPSNEENTQSTMKQNKRRELH